MTLHTQREEDIKEFDNSYKCFTTRDDGSIREYYDFDVYDVKSFISNIYIKIAEEEVKRLEEIASILKIAYDINPTEFKEGAISVITREVLYKQEELNKLKA